MDRDYNVGVQSVVFQDYSLADLLDELGETGIRHLELWDHHLSADDDEETISDAAAAIADAGIDVCGYGVVDLADVGQARPHVAFADRLGADYVTVNYPPDRDHVTEELIDLAEEYGSTSASTTTPRSTTTTSRRCSLRSRTSATCWTGTTIPGWASVWIPVTSSSRTLRPTT